MSTRKSLLFSFLDRYASLGISIGSSMVIARLLTPAEIGVFSVTMVLLTLVASVRDLGAGQYLVQERQLTVDRIRAVWMVQLGLGLAIALLVLAASYPVAVFYKEPRMRDIMLVIAVNYAVNPFGSLTYAWLMREMRFESLALMRFLSAITGAAVSLLLAWHQFGPISLAFGSLTSTVVNALLAVYFRPKDFPWMPGISEIKRVLAFGSKLSASSIVAVFAGGSPELLLGKLQDLHAAGLYSRANGLVGMFNRLIVDAVSTVCLPWFSKQAREQDGFVDSFLKATAYVSVLGWSFCGFIVCLAHPMMRLLYGPQWDESVDLTRLLALGTAFAAPAALCNAAMLSSGALTGLARVTVASAVVTVALVAAGATHGMMAVGACAALASGFTSVYAFRVTASYMKLPWRGLMHVLRLSGQVSLVAAIGPLIALLVYGPRPESIVMPLVLGTALSFIGFVSAVLFFEHPLQAELKTMWSKIWR
ncbi:MAG: hypothetical protein JWQ88_835 [Rhodoferax sp.]|nr:hypothetical protein [Rhodoferax sp.]